MPCAVRIDPARHVSYVTGFGVVTFSDLADAQRELAHHPDFHPVFPLLIDLRDAREVFLTREEMQTLMTESPFAASTRRAILVSSEGTFGLARTYQQMREYHTSIEIVRACRTLKECADWLGVDLD